MTNKKTILEIATFTIEGAINAEKAGADRIELCENASDGGTTPSAGTLALASKILSIPIFPIIRPRGGNFVYSENEFEILKEDILLCKKLGFKGVVFGILDAKGEIDMVRNAALVSLAKPMEVTFHRAFDRTKDPFVALEQLIEIGFDRILTSGQYPSVVDGLELLQKLTINANHRIIIMPGSGLKSSNVLEIAKKLGVSEFHTAARKNIFNPEIFSPESMQESASYIGIDEDEIRSLQLKLKSFNS